MPKTDLLIVEDDTKVAQALAQGLTEAGYSVSIAADGADALFRFLEDAPDLVVLDLNLPKRDGLDVLRALRKARTDVPVLIVSARDTIDDRVLGLETGADDYLVKPFAFPELLARVRALKRRRAGEPMLHMRIGDLEADLLARKVTRAGRRIDLTPREFQILELLLRNHGSIVSRETIGREVWRVQRATPLDNVIDVHLVRLRRKIDAPGETPLIHTVRGVGVLLSEVPYGT